MKQSEFEKSCSLCEYAQEIRDEECLLCEKRGIVARHHACRKFSLDLFKLSPTPRALCRMDPENNFNDILH